MVGIGWYVRGRMEMSPVGQKIIFTAAEIGRLQKSAETPIVSTVHHPLGTEGLWHTPSKKVPERQQLPAYIQNIAHALIRDQGLDRATAISYAVNAVKRWAKGKLGWGKRKVTPEVQAAARRAVAEWEKLKASHH